jgi:ribulose-phosphate 3-epimerase
MTVNPGFGGQKFITNSIRRIEEAIAYRTKYKAKFLIEIDGGVSNETIIAAKKAGVDVFVAGSAIFDADNITAATAELKNLVR